MRGLLLTCEHASNAVPARYRHLFEGAAARALQDHRGYDIGAGALALRLARHFGAPLQRGAITRLLVDLNRSLHHRGLHGPRAAALPEAERAALLARWYTPFRTATAQALGALLRRGPVLHLSVHSFTPVLDGAARRCDIGLLYDPARPREAAWARALREALRLHAPHLRVRANYPYRGVADGHATALRRVHGDARYAGIELEVNQRLLADARGVAEVARAVAAAMTTAWDARHG